MERIADHKNNLIRGGLARNPAIPLSLLACLVEDLDPDVSEFALNNFNRRMKQCPE